MECREFCIGFCEFMDRLFRLMTKLLSLEIELQDDGMYIHGCKVVLKRLGFYISIVKYQ